MPTTERRSKAARIGERRAVRLRIGGIAYALPVEEVELILPAAEVVPIPGAPRIVLGMFDFHGRLFPVLDAPCRLGQASGPIRASELFVLTRAAGRAVALRVDGTDGLLAYTEADHETSGRRAHDSPWVKGVIRLPDGLLFVHDVDAFLTDDEASALDAAVEAGPWS